MATTMESMAERLAVAEEKIERLRAAVEEDRKWMLEANRQFRELGKLFRGVGDAESKRMKRAMDHAMTLEMAR